MDQIKTTIEAKIEVAQSDLNDVMELNDLQLAIVGGGIGTTAI